MNYEYEIDKLKKAVANLNNTVLQMAKNNTKEVSKTDSTANEVKAITPYTETKAAYFGETEKVFYDVPSGKLTVFFDNYADKNYQVNRVGNRVTVYFDALTEQTDITISIQ